MAHRWTSTTARAAARRGRARSLVTRRARAADRAIAALEPSIRQAVFAVRTDLAPEDFARVMAPVLARAYRDGYRNGYLAGWAVQAKARKAA
jgi:hypothetical protein